MEETRHRFHEALWELEQKTLDGLELVIEQLDRALESVGSRDTELAATVVSDDDRINRRYREIHEDALSLLARQCPVAGDLRLVAALLDIVRCIERMGDQCADIAKLVPLSSSEATTDADIRAADRHAGGCGDPRMRVKTKPARSCNAWEQQPAVSDHGRSEPRSGP